MAELQIGMKGEATLTVDATNTADQGGKGAVGVHVLGTPSLVGLLEMAAWATVQEHLEPGMASVGTVVNVRHLAATPLGMKVTAHAELVGIEGRRLRFQIWAEDEVERVAEAEHERYVVNLEKALEKARAKGAGRAG